MAKLGPIAIKLFGYRIVFYQGADMPERGVLEIGDGLIATDVPPATSNDKGTTRIALDSASVAALSGVWAQSIRLHVQIQVLAAMTGSPVYGYYVVRNTTAQTQTLSAAVLYAKGVVTSNDTNYYELRLNVADSAGTTVSSAVQTLTTKTAASGGTGDWDPTTPSKRRFTFGGGTIALTSGQMLSLEFYKHGTGVDLPTFDLFFS